VVLDDADNAVAQDGFFVLGTSEVAGRCIGVPEILPQEAPGAVVPKKEVASRLDVPERC
jgi:hypothetical protein